MAKRHKNEIILGRWFVDAADLRNFVHELRLRYQSSVFPRDSDLPPWDLLTICSKYSDVGIEVVFRDDTFFVGKWSHNYVTPQFQIHETWIECLIDDTESACYAFPVPLARSGAADAKRIAKHYTQVREEAARLANEEWIKERSRPTWSNRLLNLVEAHFIWVLVGFFSYCYRCL